MDWDESVDRLDLDDHGLVDEKVQSETRFHSKIIEQDRQRKLPVNPMTALFKFTR